MEIQMFRKIAVRAVIGLATLAMPIASISSVQAVGPGGSYSSGIACVNLGSASASIAITFYAADSGTAITTYSVPSAVGPKANVVLFTPDIPGLPGSLQGSAVVSSDQQVACTADAQRSDGTPGTIATPARASTSESFDTNQAGSTLYVPQVAKQLGQASTGFFDSYIAVQNIESTAVTATVSYVDRFGVAYPAATESASIPPQASHYFYQGANANLPSNLNGAAKIVSSDLSKKLAATAVVYNDGTTISKSQMSAYNAVSAGANKLTIPQWVRNYYGFQSGANIMNVGATTTTVTTTMLINGSTFTRIDTLGPNRIAQLYTPSMVVLAPVDSFAPGSRTGSAVMQAAPGGTIIANVNLRNDGACVGATAIANCGAIPANTVGAGTALNAFADGTATTKAVVSRFPKTLGGATVNGGFTIVNSTNVAGTCNMEFVGNTIPLSLTNITLPAAGVINRYAGSMPNVTAGSQNPVSIVCTQPVFVSVNSRADLVTYAGDSNTSWNAINIP
jgi:hypothetical protein